MKFFVLLTLLFTVSCMDNTPVPEVSKKAAAKVDALKSVGDAEEDCDDKAAKTVEIKEETISLTNDTGCTLE
jgi:hypothetical protein